MFEFLEGILKIGKQYKLVDDNVLRGLMEEGSRVKASCVQGNYSRLDEYMQKVFNTVLPPNVTCTVKPEYLEAYDKKTGIKLRWPREKSIS
jgi:hypothetical protein